MKTGINRNFISLIWSLIAVSLPVSAFSQYPEMKARQEIFIVQDPINSALIIQSGNPLKLNLQLATITRDSDANQDYVEIQVTAPIHKQSSEAIFKNYHIVKDIEVANEERFSELIMATDFSEKLNLIEKMKPLARINPKVERRTTCFYRSQRTKLAERKGLIVAQINMNAPGVSYRVMSLPDGTLAMYTTCD